MTGVRFFVAMWSLVAPHDQASILSATQGAYNPLPERIGRKLRLLSERTKYLQTQHFMSVVVSFCNAC